MELLLQGVKRIMLIKMEGNNFNQRCVVHLPNDICRTIIGSGGSGGYHVGNEPKVIVKNRRNANDGIECKNRSGILKR